MLTKPYSFSSTIPIQQQLFLLLLSSRLKTDALCFWDVTYVKKNDASCSVFPGYYADNLQSAKEKCNVDPECEGFVNSNCDGSQFDLCGTPLRTLTKEYYNIRDDCLYKKNITRNYLESSWSMWHWNFVFAISSLFLKILTAMRDYWKLIYFFVMTTSSDQHLIHAPPRKIAFFFLEGVIFQLKWDLG